MLTEYRQPDQETLNLTLRVLSCAPRVYMIDDFLSDVEVDHFLQLATGMKLSRSTTSGNFADEKVEKNGVANTRTSENSWVYRHASPIIDSIYRRAADLLHIDEALMRPRTAEEFPGVPSKHSIAEALQLVRYTEGQEYTAHHDFGTSLGPKRVLQLRMQTYCSLPFYRLCSNLGRTTASAFRNFTPLLKRGHGWW